MSAEAVLRSTLVSGLPCVLFLGQDMFSRTSSNDSVLSLLLERKGLTASSTKSWRDALGAKLSSEDYEWLTERFERTVASEGVQDALDLPWSAVFTSAIDPRFLRRLETRGRQPEAITSSEHFPRVPRSTARPPTHYLFGRSSDTSDSSRCPGTVNELARRLARHTAVLLARIPDTVTPLGLLVIEGYRAGRDWLPLESLLGAIPSNEGMKVLWLGVDDATRASPLFADLGESGSLITDPRSLDELIFEMRASGDFSSDAFPVLHEPGVISLKESNFIEISPSLRLRVEASAAIVDDDWTKPPSPLSKVAEEDLFRRFHGGAGSVRALIEGVARGFSIKRSFEDALRSRVEVLLTTPGRRERVVVVHGQSGTGKSLALARLAIVARNEFRVPVLFAVERIPEAADVEAFCEVIDRSGSGPTLLLCDANSAYDRYFALSDALQSRGRRHLIVGTTYRQLHSDRRNSFELIEASEDASPAECAGITSLVRRYGGPELHVPKTLDGDHFIALLYRSISAGRPQIASGLTSEARFAARMLRTRTQRPRAISAPSLLAQKLVAAGWHSGEQALFDRVDDVARDQDAPDRLIDYVMAAGRIDVSVPLNLLMRALRARSTMLDYQLISELFDDLDLFRWRHADEDRTELLVGVRLRLEAELICRRRLAGTSREIDCFVDLIDAVRPRGVDRDCEQKFLLELLQKAGRQGPRADAYAVGYRRIGEALTKLRTTHGVEDASLMLQESNFRRSWLWFHRNEVTMDRSERDTVLDEAREAVESAIAKVEGKQLRAGRRTRENLYVERASIYGFLAVGHARSYSDPSIIWADYQAARAATRRAMSVAPSYFPLDVALWTPADILKEAQTGLTQAQQSELRADIYSTLDRIDPEELTPDQREQFHARRSKIGSAIEDSGLTEAALRALELLNPSVATFLRARAICPEILSSTVTHFSPELRQKAREAVEFLTSRGAAIAGDLRCLRLQLEFAWAAETGERLLRGERKSIPCAPAQRSELLILLREIRDASGDSPDSQLRYLESVLTWVTGDVRDAERAWRDLARDTEFEDRRRVVRRLIMTNASGAPMLHRGRLVENRSQGHWTVEVNGLPGRIELLERDFRGQIFRTGSEVRDFRIAFNYLGPIADPIDHYGSEP